MSAGSSSGTGVDGVPGEGEVGTPSALVPQVIIHQDNTPLISGITLDEDNFPLWSNLMEMRIGARNKMGYLDGTIQKPNPSEATYATWVTENNKVKNWLIDAMSPSLMQRFIRLPTAAAIWEAVAKTFYDGSDETKLFELNRRSFSLKQDGVPFGLLQRTCGNIPGD